VIRVAAAALLSAVAVVFATSTRAGGLPNPAPLIGASYTHYAISDCSLSGTGIVANYDLPFVRDIVRHQLAAMRRAGIASLRLILWHMHEPGDRAWGIISSFGGRLSDRDRANLADYLSDVRAAGFQRMTISFAPAVTNDPRNGDTYDSSLFEENWGFISDTRAVVKQYGPPTTHLDLMNEGAPANTWRSSTIERVKAYIAMMYRSYVLKFGNSDVVVSSIAGPGRLRNLIDAYAASGVGYPNWFEVHVSYDPAKAFANLTTADAMLAAQGLAQPLVIGEAPYDDLGVAATIGDFERSSSRPIDEILEWPLTRDGPCTDISVSPPYRANAYINGLGWEPRPPRIKGEP
jgi:hypothetical protein